MQIPFKHQQSSHCESGVTANLLTFYGLPISEALAFGVGEGLFFGYLPFIKVNGLPLTTFRCRLGAILSRTVKRLNGRLQWRKFRNPQKAMDALDALLEEGIPVGCRTGAFWLPYFPPAFRFHFNMHNLVVYGKDGDEYLISDPVFPEPVRCASSDLMKARFAQGPMPPKGRLYYVKQAPRNVDWPPLIRRALRSVGRAMLHTPGPVIGVSGIRFLARQMVKWPHKLGPRKAALYVGQLIRMQEEIGTGGAGFRFMYAAFLQEAGTLLANPPLEELATEMTRAGDLWRAFAVAGARICKGRNIEANAYTEMSELLQQCATAEETLYRRALALIREKSI